MKLFKKPKNIIQKKLGPFYSDTLVKAPSRQYLRVRDSEDSEESESRMIIKYAPKYSKFLLLESCKDWKLRSALKRIKKVEYVKEGWSNDSKNRHRLILQNKFKMIQIYKQAYSEKLDILTYKAFVNIKKLHLPLNYSSNDLGSRKFLRYLPGMRKIKSFSLQIDAEASSTALEKVNKMQRFLCSLKSLKVFCVTDRKMKILPSLIRYPNILAKITDLSINPVAEVKAEKIFESLFQHCKNMTSLSMDFSMVSGGLIIPDKIFELASKNCGKLSTLSMKLPDRLPFEFNESIHSTKNLRILDKLQVLHVSFDDMFYFLEGFILPPSIKEIELDTRRGSWASACNKFFSKYLNSKSMGEIQNLFENDKRLRKVCDNWSSGLKNLASLSLLACQDLEGRSAIPILMKYLVANLEKLEILDLHFSNYYPTDYDSTNYEYERHIIWTDLNRIFAGFQDGCRNLKKLKLSFAENHRISGMKVPKDFVFPKETEIDLSEREVEFLREKIEHLFDSVKKGSVVKLSISEKVYYYRDLLNLLKILQRTPRNINLHVELSICDIDLESIREAFEEWREETEEEDIAVVENVTLKVLLPNEQYWQVLNFPVRKRFKHVCFE